MTSTSRFSRALVAVGCMLTAGVAFSAAAVLPAPEDRSNLAVSLSAGVPVASEPDAVSPLVPSVFGCPITALVNDASTSGSERAPNLKNRFGRSVYLILASEMSAAGIAPGTQFGQIGWTFSTAPGVSGNNNLIVYMQNTADVTNSKSATWATAITGMTIVHNAVTPIPNVAGSWDIDLSAAAAFTYTGGGLYVAFDAQYPVGTLSTITVVSCNSTGLPQGLKGAQANASNPTTLATSDFRPETRLSALNATIFNDASVDLVVSYGALPRDLVGPQAVQAVVINRGVNPIVNLPVTLHVSGANAFNDIQNVASLAACSGRAIVTFAPFAASNLGSNTLQVTVPADQVGSNDVKSVPMDVTVPQYSFKYPATIATGGIGLNGATGAFVGKFTTAFATSVTAVTLEFAATGGQTYRVAIYADSGLGTPGAQLYLDAADRPVVVAGPVTIPIGPVPVGPGDFFVGIQQTNTINAALSFDNEVPIRAGTFFLTFPLPPTTWVDFSPGNNFKMNVGVILDPCAGGPAVCDDGNTCTIDGCGPGTGCTHANATDGTGCNDNNACSVNDACSGGSCVGAPITAPPETQNVAAAADKVTYTWSPAAFATRYDVVRGSTAALPVGPGGGDEVCFDDLPGTTLNDPALPALGACFWYLSRGENTCGNGTYGTQGVNGAPGPERSTTTCP